MTNWIWKHGDWCMQATVIILFAGIVALAIKACYTGPPEPGTKCITQMVPCAGLAVSTATFCYVPEPCICECAKVAK